MVSWEYIRRRRKWTAELILGSLPDRSWESFQAFFAERGIECPREAEYKSALKSLQPAPAQPKPEPAPPKKTEPVKKRTSRGRKKKTAEN